MDLKLSFNTTCDVGKVSGRRIIFNPEAPSCGVYGAKLVKPSLTFAAPQTYASDFRVGVQKKSAKILTMEAKTVKTNKRTESGQKWLKSDVLCDYFEQL